MTATKLELDGTDKKILDLEDDENYVEVENFVNKFEFTGD
jgi:hypothetical protein